MHLNMRIPSHVASVPEITYKTGLLIVTMDDGGLEQEIAMLVINPQSMKSSCHVGSQPSLADGVLDVAVDGEEVQLAPEKLR